MSWLRLDDGFSRNPKVTALNHRERWTWIDILCYCARYKTDGFLPENIREFVPGATQKLLATCLDLELVDDLGEGLHVHDWEEYAPKDPTGSIRQAKWRRAHSRNENRNGPRNAHVTDEVTEEAVTEPVIEAVTNPLPRARAGARVPVPQLHTASNEAAEAAHSPADSPDAQRLVAEFVFGCKQAGIEAPKRLIGQVAQETGKLIREGIPPDRIRDGYRRMVQRGIVQPSLLPNFVAEASIPVEARAANGAGMTPAQILEMTRETP